MGRWGNARKFTPEEAAEAVHLYLDDRLSLCEVGRRLNRDPSSVRVMFVRNGIEIRDAKSSYREYVEQRRNAESEAIAQVHKASTLTVQGRTSASRTSAEPEGSPQ